jgi:hypothetical protein
MYHHQRRAYSYFFGGNAPPSPTIAQGSEMNGDDSRPDSPTRNGDMNRDTDANTPPQTPSGKAHSFEPASREILNASSTSIAGTPEPPSPNKDDPPTVQIEKLKAKLDRTKAELEEANDVVQKQNETITSIDEEYAGRTKVFEEREATLEQDKKNLEEHMVSVVVQQVHEAKAKGTIP